jgi:SAM-dependent methyltransferase
VGFALGSRYKSAIRWAIRRAAWLAGLPLPLSARKALVASAGRRALPGKLEFAMGMLEDVRRRDPDALHRFLWSNHLAYAETYEVCRRFGAARINLTRHRLFRNITAHLRERGLDPHSDIRSVFDVGCSMGYLLRHIEEEVFPSAATLHGLDIDAYAIQTGAAYLASLRSRVKLFVADVDSAEQVMRQNYDLVLCCGVLMYVNESTANKVVRAMLARATHLVGLICLAPAGEIPQRSVMRDSDGAFIHNMESMITRAGGRIVSREWIGTSASGSSPSHVILAEPVAKAHE